MFDQIVTESLGLTEGHYVGFLRDTGNSQEVSGMSRFPIAAAKCAHIGVGWIYPLLGKRSKPKAICEQKVDNLLIFFFFNVVLFHKQLFLNTLPSTLKIFSSYSILRNISENALGWSPQLSRQWNYLRYYSLLTLKQRRSF